MKSAQSERSAPYAVLSTSPAHSARAAALARELGVELLLGLAPSALTEPPFVLLCDDQGLTLQQTGKPAPGPVRVDFASGAVDHRRRFGGGKGQMIARAVGVKAGVYPSVLDATAGLGRDAFVLATLGCPVALLERTGVVHALLADGLARAVASGDDELRRIVSRMALHRADARDYLAQLSGEECPDVVYLDPMFPERGKSARVKKEMEYFHTLVGGDQDADQLLALALDKARYRVLVKRPRKAPPLPGPAPGLQMDGKTSRYDIYPLRRLPDRLGD